MNRKGSDLSHEHLTYFLYTEIFPEIQVDKTQMFRCSDLQYAWPGAH
jgi:hypothetical protein